MNLRVSIVAVLALVQLIGCAAPISRATSAHIYARAIEEATVVSGRDRKGDLRRCVANWQTSSSTRTPLLQEVLDNRNELRRDSVLLEIGSSGFPRYDYVYVENEKLLSSFGSGQLDIHGTVLGALLDETMEHELTNLTGRAYSTADDASCYFLSIKKGRVTRSIAIYGELRVAGKDSLIQELLAAVGKRR